MSSLFEKTATDGKHSVRHDPITGRIFEVKADVEVTAGLFKQLTYRYVSNPAQLEDLASWMDGQGIIALDLETSGLDYRRDTIATLQLGVYGHTSGVDAWVIDLRTVADSDLEPVFSMLESTGTVKLGQNLGFEYLFLRHHYGLRIRKLADTQVVELVLRAGLFEAAAQKKARAGGRAGGARAGYTFCSMKELMYRYGKINIDKGADVRLSFADALPGQHSVHHIVYAASDVVYPFIISEAQKPIVAERGLRNILKVEMEALPIIHEMTYQGMGIDAVAWRQLWQEALTERNHAERTLDTMVRGSTLQSDLFDTADVKTRPIYPKTNKPINYSSPVQVKWAITAICKERNWPIHMITTVSELKKLKLEWGKEWLERQQERDETVTEDDIPDRVLPEDRYLILLESDKITLTLARARKQLPADLVNALMNYSKADQRASSFGLEWLNKNVNPVTKRIHPAFHQAVTTTGRLSSQPNLQNIPHDARYRKCFIPRKGFKFVIADYSQQEPRLLAQESQDPVYLRTYIEADDLYLAVAEAMLGYRPDRSTEAGELERQVFKIIVLSMAYRSGVAKLRDQLTLGLADAIEAGKAEPPTMEYASEMHKRFFEVHAKVKEYQEKCSNNANPKNAEAPRIWDDMLGEFVTFVTAPCGRKRFFPKDALNTYTEAANAPIQGGSASMTKAAAVLLQRRIDAKGWANDMFIVNMVHDEIVVEAREEIAEEAAEMLRKSMLEAGKLYCPEVPIVAEFPKKSNGVVPHWTKELK